MTIKLSRTRNEISSCEILLISPFFISVETSTTSFRQEVLELIPTYIDIVRAKSGKYGTRFIDAHAMFQQLLKHRDADVFCPEPVHPNATGHLAIAQAVYEILA